MYVLQGVAVYEKGMPRAARLSGLHAVDIGTVARIDLDDFAFIDEKRYTHLGTGLHRSRLRGVGGSVALEARLGVGYLQLRLDGHLGIEDGVGGSVADHFDYIAFLHEINAGDEVLGDGNLIVSLLIHEDIVLSFHVKELIGTALHAYILKCLTDVEALFEYTAAHYILERGAHDGVALTGLHMEKVNAEVELAIHTDAGALLDVLRFNHECLIMFDLYFAVQS